jgi:hypothetical protein
MSPKVYVFKAGLQGGTFWNLEDVGLRCLRSLKGILGSLSLPVALLLPG